jgi:hypothetical protein
MAAPRRLGPYATLEELSSRAFTATYRASQAALGRKVVIRALKPTVSPSSPFAEEIEREAAMLARLDHPSFVRLYDFVRTDETAYLVLEDKGGVMLTELVLRGRLGFDAAAAVTLELARGLGHAHERGVVVKDLRPQVIELGHDGSVRIVELASAYLNSMPSLPEPIEIGDALARPDFMAPEQILGERMGPRSDVFAAGAIFHYLATGVAPFAADDAKDVAYRVRNDAPASIADLPRPFERALALALAKDPADRFADGNGLASALEAALGERDAPSTAVLVTRALAAAKLGVELTDNLSRERASKPAKLVGRGGPSVRSAAQGLAVVGALVIAGGIAIESTRDPEARATSAIGEGPTWGSESEGHGYLRVVATPWADVLIDGERVDTTPIGKPISVRAGRHWVTFKHPSAPDEQRSVKVVAGQTALLDVAMRVNRPIIDAGMVDPSLSP